MMSQTKTFTGTAIAIAEAEGLLSLDERLVDIFPEYVPENPSENLQKMTIRHLLCMGGGMETTCKMDGNWLKNFFATPVPNEPGTAFFYNDSAVTVLPAIIRKKTGLHIVDFLWPRLFDKIGIDADNLTLVQRSRRHGLRHRRPALHYGGRSTADEALRRWRRVGG